MSTLKTINIIHPSGTVNNIVGDSSGNITVGGSITFPDDSEQTTAATSYTLPTATDTVLGGVKIGTGIDINSGVISTSAIPLTRRTALVGSASNKEFTSIPSTVKRITVILFDFSPDARIQLGSGSYTTSGYVGVSGAGAYGQAYFSAGFDIFGRGSGQVTGNIFITNVDGNKWVMSGTYTVDIPDDVTYPLTASGYVTLSGVLDRLRIAGATNGTCNIMYE